MAGIDTAPRIVPDLEQDITYEPRADRAERLYVVGRFSDACISEGAPLYVQNIVNAWWEATRTGEADMGSPTGEFWTNFATSLGDMGANYPDQQHDSMSSPDEPRFAAIIRAATMEALRCVPNSEFGSNAAMFQASNSTAEARPILPLFGEVGIGAYPAYAQRQILGQYSARQNVRGREARRAMFGNYSQLEQAIANSDGAPIMGTDEHGDVITNGVIYRALTEMNQRAAAELTSQPQGTGEHLRDITRFVKSLVLDDSGESRFPQIISTHHANLLVLAASYHDAPKYLGTPSAQVAADHEILGASLARGFVGKTVLIRGKTYTLTPEDAAFIADNVGDHENLFKEEGRCDFISSPSETVRAKALLFTADVLTGAIKPNADGTFAFDLDELRTRFTKLYFRHMDKVEGKLLEPRPEWGVSTVNDLIHTFSVLAANGLEITRDEYDRGTAEVLLDAALEAISMAKKANEDRSTGNFTEAELKEVKAAENALHTERAKITEAGLPPLPSAEDGPQLIFAEFGPTHAQRLLGEGIGGPDKQIVGEPAKKPFVVIAGSRERTEEDEAIFKPAKLEDVKLVFDRAVEPTFRGRQRVLFLSQGAAWGDGSYLQRIRGLLANEAKAGAAAIFGGTASTMGLAALAEFKAAGMQTLSFVPAGATVIPGRQRANPDCAWPAEALPADLTVAVLTGKDQGYDGSESPTMLQITELLAKGKPIDYILANGGPLALLNESKAFLEMEIERANGGATLQSRFIAMNDAGRGSELFSIMWDNGFTTLAQLSDYLAKPDLATATTDTINLWVQLTFPAIRHGLIELMQTAREYEAAGGIVLTQSADEANKLEMAA